MARRRQWHPTPVLLPGKSHGRRSLVGCSPWGRQESDTTERLHFDFSLSCIGEGNGKPLQCSCLENPRDGGAWWAAVYGVTQSWTWLKWLSSSSSSMWLLTKKDAQCEIFEICSISGNMRTAVWETAPQVSLINCSKEIRGKDSICMILVKGEYMQSSTFFFFFGRKFLLVSWSFYKSWETIVTMKDFSAFLDMRRSKNWTNGINSWEYLTVWKSVLPVAWSTGCLISTLYPELHQGILEVSSYSSTRFNPHRGRWQGPMASANLWLT